MTIELKPLQQIQPTINITNNYYTNNNCNMKDCNNSTIDKNSPTQNSSSENNKLSTNYVNIVIKGIVSISLLFVGYEIKPILKIIFNAIL